VKNGLATLGKTLRWSAGVTLLLAALAAVAVYLVSLRVDDYRDEIAEVLSREINLEIRLDGRLRVTFTPDLRIQIGGARAMLPGAGEIVRVNELEADLDLLRSVLARSVRFDGIAVREGVVTLPSEMSGKEIIVDVLSLRNLEGGAGHIAVAARGRLGDSPLSLDGSLIPRRAWTGAVAEGSDPPFSGDMMLGLGEIRLRMHGRLGLPLAEDSVDIELALEAPGYESAAVLVGSPGVVDLTGLGKIHASGRLVHGPTDLALLGLGLEIALDPHDSAGSNRVSARGDIFELSTTPRLALDLEVSTDDAARLTERFRGEADGMTLGRGTVRLSGTPDALRFSDIDLQLAHRAGTTAGVRGLAERSGEIWSLELRATLEADDNGAFLDTLSQAVGPVGNYLREAPLLEQAAVREVGPFAASFSARGRYDDVMSLALSDVSIETGSHGKNHARLTGDLRNVVPAPSGVALTLELDSPLGSPIFQALVPGSPALTHFSGRTKLTDAGGALQLREYRVTAVAAGGVRLSLAGDSLELQNLNEFDLVLAIEAERLSTVGALFDLPMPPAGPVLIETPLAYRPDAIRAEGFSVRVGESLASGSFLFERRPGGVPRLALSAQADSARLVDLGVGSLVQEINRRKQEGSTRHDGIDGAESDDDSLNLDAPLPIAGLSSFEGTLDLRIGTLTGRGGLKLQNVNLSVGLDDGYLATNAVDLEWSGGRMRLEIEIDSKAVTPSAGLRVQGSGIPAELLLAQWDVEDAVGGPLELNVELHTQGDTARQAIAGLDGRVFLEMGAGRIATKYSHAMQLDYVYSLDPGRRPAYEETNCIVGHFDLHDERVRLETVFFDSGEKQVLATGDISLVDGGLSLLLTPRFKDSLPGSMAAAIRVSGTLDDPKPQVEPLATASATTRGLIERTLAPARRYFPRLSQSVEDVIRATDNAADVTGADLVTQFWIADEPLECSTMAEGVRRDAERSMDRPLRNLLLEPLQRVPAPGARRP